MAVLILAVAEAAATQPGAKVGVVVVKLLEVVVVVKVPEVVVVKILEEVVVVIPTAAEVAEGRKLAAEVEDAEEFVEPVGLA